MSFMPDACCPYVGCCIYHIDPVTIFRCLYRRCLPLPIPNRAVKPARADGTAVTGGRVGRCQILYKPLQLAAGAFFIMKFLQINPSKLRYLVGCLLIDEVSR